MKKVFHLENCTTCQRILKEVKWPADIEFQNIKAKGISSTELTQMLTMVDSAEDLFSKRARKYRGLGLHEKNLSDKDIQNYLLEEYTFLKRPVIVYDNFISIGNSKKVVERLVENFK